MNQSFTFVDLFAGIGGFHQALHALGGRCVAACELDPFARQTYQANHTVPDEHFYEDIFDVNPATVPRHDVLCAGFPCQPFSISGQKNGLDDERSHVITPLFNIIEASKPPMVILENVKHLKHISGGAVFEMLQTKLKELGYHVTVQLLNANAFGVPQNRERWLIVGTLGFEFSFRQPQFEPTSIKDILQADAGDFDYMDESHTLLTQTKRQPASGLIFCGYRNKSLRKVGIKEGTEHLSRVHKQPNRIYSIEGTHPTIPSQEISGRFWIKLTDNRVRKLTILECFRLMGFPDDFKKPVSQAKQYIQIGNSVCVPMVQTVAGWLLEDYFTSPPAGLLLGSNQDSPVKLQGNQNDVRHSAVI